MEQNLMVVEQLPIIKENLKVMSAIIDKKVSDAMNLVATEDNKKAIKDIRAELNSEFKKLEDMRKEVKNKVLKPYNDFETIYKETISDKFKKADADLKSKVDRLDQDLKDEKEGVIRAYFDELATSMKIDWIDFEQMHLNIRLSDSEKSLKEQVKAFVEKVASDLQTIWNLDNASEITVEYKKSLDLNSSIQIVTERHKELEKIQEVKPTEKVEEKPKVETLTAPSEVKHVYTIKLSVSGTKEQLQNLKKYLIESGIKYE